MSQFSPPPPPAAGPPGMGTGQVPAEAYQRPPMSIAAVVGFVSSLLLCIPIVAPLAGLIGGILGISATAGGRRRGRGLAIAAIPIALVAGSLQLGGYQLIKLGVQMVKADERLVQPMFRAGADAMPDAVRRFYAHTSARFKQQVSEAQLIEWVQQVRSKHGTLHSVSPPARDKDSEKRVVLSYTGQFTNGSAQYALYLLPALELIIDDLTVDGESPLPNP